MRKQVEKLYVRALWLTSLALMLYLFATHKLGAFQDRASVADSARRTKIVVR
jgi:hypothetical protein